MHYVLLISALLSAHVCLSQKTQYKVGKIICKAFAEHNPSYLEKVLPTADQVIAYSGSLGADMDSTRTADFVATFDDHKNHFIDAFESAYSQALEDSINPHTAKFAGIDPDEESIAITEHGNAYFTITWLNIYFMASDRQCRLSGINIFSLDGKWYIGDDEIYFELGPG